MQTLDLSGDRKKSDGPLKSLLWPTVDNAWDVDYLGQQGFWICLVVGLLNFGMSFLAGSAMPNSNARIIVLVAGVFALFAYVIGGMGVRESSWPAAALVFALYLAGFLASGAVPGVLPIILGAVLLSNARATYLASHWKQASDDEDRPTRFKETLRDKLVDQWPPKLWPILKIPFYIATAFLLLLLVYGFIVHLLTPRPAGAMDENTVPSAVVLPSESQ